MNINCKIAPEVHIKVINLRLGWGTKIVNLKPMHYYYSIEFSIRRLWSEAATEQIVSEN